MPNFLECTKHFFSQLTHVCEMPDFDCLECVMPVTLQSHALTMLKKTCLIVRPLNRGLVTYKLHAVRRIR